MSYHLIDINNLSDFDFDNIIIGRKIPLDSGFLNIIFIIMIIIKAVKYILNFQN